MQRASDILTARKPERHSLADEMLGDIGLYWFTNCIGASFAQFEMRVIMRAILERAHLRAADPAPERPRVRNITVAPARGCRVLLERRLRPASRGEVATTQVSA